MLEKGSLSLPAMDFRLLAEDLVLSEQWEIPELSELPELQSGFHPLFTIGYQYLAPYLGRGVVNVSSDILKNFLWCLENMYIANPYHNAFHGALVMHSTTWIAAAILETE
eukprot:Gregarina_sp_Poly_1__3383@NODE_1977_length_2944_cov_24_061522_g1273_i0_p4_GENE_NODE_1977_length_2944_cov_24_061522_g1273_i0NODE_1977_length_2944_cov_24_061522_g1273_i0_p4_ORF_typecomplete_len110_score7_55_NODE_1977_length_2944_cov_24_061522_g1273_i012621591